MISLCEDEEMVVSRELNPEDFSSGDRIRVIDGIFIGLRGVVIGPREAEKVWERTGGQRPSSRKGPTTVFVLLNIFDRPTLVCLETFQIEHSQD